MRTKWNKKEGNEGTLNIEFTGKEWAEEVERQFKVASKNVNVDGFRKGKAPKAFLKRAMNMNYVYQMALDALLDKNYSEALKKHDIKLIAQPELTVTAMDEDKVKVTLKVQVRPEVELTQYKGFGIEKENVEVTEEDINKELERMQEQYAELSIKEEGTVEQNDTATIDFEGFVDGVAFEGGKGENYPLTIGSGAFIPGFEEQLVGMGIEETKDIVVIFPSDYVQEELAGKEATFKVTVHEIKTRVLPSLEEVVEEAEIEGVSSVEDLKLNVKTRLENQKENAAEQAYTEALYEAFLAANPVDVPQPMIDTEVENMFGEIQQNIQNQGLDFATFTKLTGKDAASIKEEIAPQAAKRAHLNLLIDAVVKAEALSASDEEVQAEVDRIAEMYGEEFDKIKAYVESIKPQIAADLVNQKALEIIRG